MSLLGTPVYANPSTPLWVGAGGGTSTGPITASSFRATGNFTALDASGNTALLITSGGGNPALGLSYIQSAGTIKFGQIGTGNTNSSLAISAYGANNDVLTIGGQIVGGGVTPVSYIVGSPTVVALNAGTPSSLTITPAVTLVNNGIYDIQVSGYWAVGSGTTTPATADVASLTLQTGTGSSPGLLKYQYTDSQYPALAEAPWAQNTFHPIHIRARMPSNGYAMTLTAEFTGSGTYPSSALSLVISDLTIVRVA